MTLSTAFAGDVGFVEEFALGKDRTAALRQLIPGTEDYYYYHALHALNTEQYDQAKTNYDEWFKRFGQSARLTEIQVRLALLTYDRDPKASLAFLKQHLGASFHHVKESADSVANYSSRFDAKSLTRASLQSRSINNELHGFEDRALEWLAAEKLNEYQRRNLLVRLKQPDLPNLVALVVEDLTAPNSGGFGSLPIHALLTKAQLEELLKRRPELINQINYINAYLLKLHPGADDDWRHDAAKTGAFLDRLLAFVRKLPPAQNSLKAHVLYHKLVFDRSQGRFEKELFLEYLKLPRHQAYMAKRALESDESRRFPSDLNANYSGVTLLAPIGNDELLVRSYLRHVFTGADSWKEFEPYINDLYLKHFFAETKIELGLGEPEKWASDLPPEMFARLKDRIDIDFAATNKTSFSVDEAVALDLHIKHVPTLIVKVFEINAANYYREFKKEIDTDINLDGLVPNSEQTFNYAEPPLRRMARKFEFPQLAKPGVYVIDFIGSGKSSRALVRKGKLRPLVTTGTAGQVISIVDEKNRPVTDARIGLGGTEYTPEKDGTVLIPFSTAPARQPIVIRRGDFASLDYLDHQPEAYALVAGIHVDREQLLSQRLATILVRPALTLNGHPVSIKLLEEVRLRIVAVDSDGIQTATDVAAFPLFEDRESTHQVRVPPRLLMLSVTLVAKVKSLTLNKPIDLADAHTVTLNGLSKTLQLDDVHFGKFGGEYIVEFLGRNGEPKPGREIHAIVKHRDFKEPVTQLLKSDAKGRVYLGELIEIEWVRANGPNEAGHQWVLPTDHTSYRRVIDSRAGETIRLPWLAAGLTRFDASLFEIIGNTIVADKFESLKATDGVLEIAGLAAGDYDLLIKARGDRIRLRVVEGVLHAGHVLGQLRHLEVAKLAPVAISGIKDEAESVTIRFKDLSTFARVHVIASRYLPEYSAFHDLGKVRDRELGGVYPGSAESVYLTGRAIGDEYRYVLDRKYQRKYPGNMLERPQLLLNPWAVRSTETAEQLAQQGDSFGSGGVPKPAAPAMPPGSQQPLSKRDGQATEQSTFLDYLGETSELFANLVPKDNAVTVKKAAFGSKQFLTIIVVDPLSTTVKHVTLPEKEATVLDLRLRNGLDPKGHFTQQKTVSILEGGKPFVLADAAGGRFEAFDSLPKLFSLYSTLLKDPRLAEFEFLARWPSLKPEEKKAKYSKYACHELSFFVFKKDPEFFKTVVKSYLANKKDKTFFDEWLLDADVKEYTAPWRHGRMNVAERVLLAQRLPNEAPKTARHLSDLFRLQPRNLDREVFLFDSSISSSGLAANGMMAGFQAAEREKAKLAFNFAGRADPDAESPPAAPSPAGDAAGRPPVMVNPSATPRNGATKAPQRMERQQEESKKKMTDAVKELDEMTRDGRKAGEEKGEGGANFYKEDRLLGRRLAEQLYRRLEPTMEWAENNYYHLPIAQQLAALVGVNPFWIDYANHDAAKPFFSKNVAVPCSNLTEVILALAVTDLPFEAKKHETKFDGPKMTFTPGGPVIAFHEEVRPAAAPPANATILVNQNFYKADDRYRDENGERSEKFLTEEFVIQTVYGCQVVVTNPTPARQKLSVLLQIPVGSLPLAGGLPTRTVILDLEPYRTLTIDYTFYFPAAGSFGHFPVHVAKNETLLAAAAPFTFNVVAKATKLDTESWDYVSQNGTNEQVMAYLERENASALNLEKIAWRMGDAAFFKSVLTLLQSRHVYQNTLWSYALQHGDVPTLREYFQHFDALFAQCGPIASTLVSYDPVARHAYEHLEYKPLVNARAHSLGQRRQIVNDRFHQQYHRYLKLLTYRTTLTDEDKLAVTYYLLLQDRVEEAMAFFKEVNAAKVAEAMQYDYCAAYLAMYGDEPKRARTIAEKHAAHPVDRWRNTFTAVLNQVDEIDGKAVKLTDAENRDARQAELAAKTPSFDFTLDAKAINLNWQNVESVTVNYYLMDVELLFSRNPFVQQTGGQFAMIKPNETKEFKLAAGQAKLSIPLPDDLAKRNVLVEVVGAGKTRSLPYYANAMDVKMSDGYGQLKVTDAASGKALAKVYVKVYLQTADGTVKFHKDGYTDLRGRFDYASVSTPERSAPTKYSVLILSDEFGAAIREVNPPQQ